MKLDLDQRRYQITLAATQALQNILNVPPYIRNDEKQRAGIQVLVREPGTRNLALVSVGKPSEAAQFFAVEKAVRSFILGDLTSAESENPEKMEYAGSVTYEMTDGTILQVSVSGAKAEEDVTIAIYVIASIVDLPPRNIFAFIKSQGGKMPDVLEQDDHYLRRLIEEA